MQPMTLSIRTKVFLTLLVACSLAVLGMHALVRWSVHHGLVELAEARQQERLERIADHLIARYHDDGGWERLATEPRLWVLTLLGANAEVLARREDYRPRPPTTSHRLRRLLRHVDKEPGVWPPTPVLGRSRRPDGPPLPLSMRVMLLDADGNIVYGRQSLLQSANTRLPLRLDGKAIGQIALLPGPFIPEGSELRFAERQGTALAVFALGMVVLSAAFALPLSARLTRPIKAFRDATRRLAGGDFKARVPTNGRDDLARLGRDINALAEALERNEQARRRWMADISHELRTPLAMLRAEIEALQDGVRRLDGHAVDALHGDVLRLTRLVDDLHELSMSDLGALDYHKRPIDPASILKDELDAFRQPFDNAGIGIDLIDRRNAETGLLGDGHRMAMLFRNLIRNSLDYTDRGGRLIVEILSDGGLLTVDLMDTPPGVPEGAMPHLFERLYRVEASRGRNTGGAGLGLAICANIVAAHEGTIDAQTSPLGGLWIRIRLPIDT